MTAYLFGAAVSVLLLATMFTLLRRRRVGEKFAAVWLVLSVAVALLVLFPTLAFTLARWVGVETPINLIFVLGIAVLFLVCVQLGVSITALEERTRRLTEEVALLRHDLDRVTRPAGDARQAPDAGGQDPWSSRPVTENPVLPRSEVREPPRVP